MDEYNDHYSVGKKLTVVFALSIAATASYLLEYVDDGALKLVTVKLPTSIVLLPVLCLLVAAAAAYRRRRIFLVDFSVYKPHPIHRRSREFLIQQADLTDQFNEQSLTFMRKMLERSGIGQDTYVPFSVINVPKMPVLVDAWLEATQVVFGAINELLGKTGVKTQDIGILVVNCSLFVPTPSLSSLVVNHYKLKESIISHNLGGMGCSAGLISVDLAKHLLKVHRNTYALVVSTENMTLNGYFGNNRSMLVTNALFRMGCAAVLLSNRRSDRSRSKYELVHTVRTHKGSDKRCYGCVFQEEDADGNIGISLSKDLMAVAGEALRTNITTLGPMVLPLSEKLKFLWSLIKRKVPVLSLLLFKGFNKQQQQPYVPNFKLAFEHFCIHAGGRAVLDEIEKNMRLSEWHMEPSRMTLWRWGNTSSSSLWYELAYTEAKGRVKKDDRVWQIAFGSGFKCNSAVWKAVRSIAPAEEKNPWTEDIHMFPVEVPKVTAIIGA